MLALQLLLEEVLMMLVHLVVLEVKLMLEVLVQRL
jgi:hypothetical protein